MCKCTYAMDVDCKGGASCPRRHEEIADRANGKDFGLVGAAGAATDAGIKSDRFHLM